MTIHLCFYMFFDKFKSQGVLNNDFISNWAFQWKMQFKSDPNKQAQEVYFLKNQAIKMKTLLL